MTILESVQHLINSKGFKICSLANPPEGDEYKTFKKKFEALKLSKREAIKMLMDFDYIVTPTEVKLPPKGNTKIYQLS